MTFDIYTPTKQFRIKDEMNYRTYNWSQFQALLRKVPELECVEKYDFSYEIDEPVSIDRTTEDVVFILRKN